MQWNGDGKRFSTMFPNIGGEDQKILHAEIRVPLTFVAKKAALAPQQHNGWDHA